MDPYVAIVMAAGRPMTADEVLEAHGLATGQWPEPRIVSRSLMAAMLRGELARIGHARKDHNRPAPVYDRITPFEIDPNLRDQLIRAGWRAPGRCRRSG